MRKRFLIATIENFKSIALFCVSLMTLTVLASSEKEQSPFQVQIILPLSGIQKEWGRSMRRGFELAQSEIVGQEGRIQVSFLDSESQKNKVAILAKDLSGAQSSEARTVVLVADDLSLEEARKHLDRGKVPYLVPYSEEKALLKRLKLGQGFSQTLEGKVSVAAQFALRDLSSEKILLFLPLDNGRIEEFLSYAKKAIGKKAQLIVESYNESIAVSALTAKVLEHKADVNWVPWMDDERLITLIKESRTNGWTRPFMGFDDWEGAQLSETLGENWIGNFLVKHYHHTHTGKMNQSFVENYKKQFDALPNEASALAYESLKFAYESFKRSAYRAQGLSLLKIYRRFGRFEGLVGAYEVRQNAPLSRPILILRTAPGGFRIEATYSAQ